MERKGITNQDVEQALNYLQGQEKSICVRRVLSFPLADNKEQARSRLKNIALSADKTISEFHWLPEYNKVCDWMVNPDGKGLILSGNSGRLKSTIIMLVLPVLFKLKYNMVVRPIESESINEMWQKIIHNPVIIVDDAGVETFVNDFGAKHEPFSRLVDMCEKKSKVLIVSTNLNSEQLEQRYGSRTTDRLDRLCVPVAFKGKSLRK